MILYENLEHFGTKLADFIQSQNKLYQGHLGGRWSTDTPIAGTCDFNAITELDFFPLSFLKRLQAMGRFNFKITNDQNDEFEFEMYRKQLTAKVLLIFGLPTVSYAMIRGFIIGKYDIAFFLLFMFLVLIGLFIFCSPMW